MSILNGNRVLKGFWKIGMVLLMATGASTFCFANGSSDDSTAGENGLTPVNLRLSWLIKGEYAHLFVAQELGYFAEEGIDITILEGSEKATPAQLLVSGDDQFSYLAADDAIVARSKGMKIKMTSCYLQKLPQVVMALPEVKLETPADMAGKTIVDTAGGSMQMILDAFLSYNGVDTDSVNLIIADWGAKTAAFLNGNVEMMAGYSTNDLATLEAKTGKDFNYFFIGDFGFNMMAHGLVASDKYIEENPEIVAAVNRAVRRGAEYTVAHPEEAADLMYSLFPDKLNKEITRNQVARTIELFSTEETEGKPYGWISEDSLERTIAIMYDNGALDSREPVGEYYTNAFIDE